MGQIHELLPLVAAEVGAIEKGQQNTHQHYRFRGIDDVLNHVGPVLAQHKVTVAPKVSDHRVEIRENAKGGLLYHATLLMTLRFVAADESFVECTTAGEANDTNGDKATNKAMAATYKYAFFFGLCLPVDRDAVDDSDRDAGDEDEAAEKRRSRRTGNEAAAGQRGKSSKLAGDKTKPANDPRAQQLADRVRELAANVHQAESPEYIARVLASLSKKYNERFEQIEGVPVDDLGKWAEKLKSEV